MTTEAYYSGAPPFILDSDTLLRDVIRDLDPGFKSLGLSNDSILQCLTHRSAWHEITEGLVGHNTIFARLGSYIWNLLTVIAAHQILDSNSRPQDIHTLSKEILADGAIQDVGHKIGLSRNFVILGNGEGPEVSPQAYTEVIYAIVGAAYFDSGFEAIYQYFEPILVKYLSRISEEPRTLADPKTVLQEIMQGNIDPSRRRIEYVVTGRSGPDHDLEFQAEIRQGQSILGTGSGKSKKTAESDAARRLLNLPSMSRSVSQWQKRQGTSMMKVPSWVQFNENIDVLRRESLEGFSYQMGVESPSNDLLFALDRALTHRSLLNESNERGLLDYSIYAMLGSYVINMYLAMELAQDIEIDRQEFNLVLAELLSKRESVFDRFDLEPLLNRGKGLQEITDRIKMEVVNSVAWCLFRYGEGNIQHLIPDVIREDLDYMPRPGSFMSPTQRLQELVQSLGIEDFDYFIKNLSPESHDNDFEATFLISGKTVGRGRGSTIRQARRMAASAAMPLPEHLLRRITT